MRSSQHTDLQIPRVQVGIFKDKRQFAETEFLEQNERFFGYRRFEYLYIEGSLAENEALIKTKIRGFFER